VSGDPFCQPYFMQKERQDEILVERTRYKEVRYLSLPPTFFFYYYYYYE